MKIEVKTRLDFDLDENGERVEIPQTYDLVVSDVDLKMLAKLLGVVGGE